jgi:tRNA(fMet)-specific endonuclease VapC
MGLILDTSVLIAAERARLDLPRLFAAHAEEPFALAAITASELLHGVERAEPGPRRRERGAFVEAVLAELDLIDFDLPVARRHAGLWAELERLGRRIGPHDLQIAATALQLDYGLVTLNPAEFRQVPGLRLEDPAAFRREPA